MDAAIKLLTAVLGASGTFFILGLKKETPPIQEPFPVPAWDDALEKARQLDQAGYNVYFSTSTFMDGNSRTKDNAKEIKCLKIDLDVEKGVVGKYQSKKEAADAMAGFCDKTGFPVPVYVDSGRGYHVYWPLETALNKEQGNEISEKFKQVLLDQNFKFDGTSTGDIARILRLPGTRNFKDPTDPLPVSLIDDEITLHDTEAICDLVNYWHKQVRNPLPLVPTTQRKTALLNGQDLPPHLVGRVISDATRTFLEGPPKYFQVIWDKSVKKTRNEKGEESYTSEGCAQLRDIVLNQKSQTEPLWRGGLSIAWACQDGEGMIHEMSKKYDGYSPEETFKKAEDTAGPYHCNTFKGLRPAVCEGCPHSGKITSPIQLGVQIRRASALDNRVWAQNKAVDEELVEYIVPDYPFPYMRGETGGVYKIMEADPKTGESPTPVLVSKNDFYAVARLKESEGSDFAVQMRLHTYTDGVIDFLVPYIDINKPDKFSETLARYSVTGFKGKMEAMRAYVMRWVEHLAQQQEARLIRQQFGWTNHGNSFVVGEKEYFADTIKHSRAAPTIREITKNFSIEGTLENWKTAFEPLTRPGMERHLFYALLGLSGPLHEIMEVPGIMVNVWGPSGCGKSTALYAGMSVWGNPKGLCAVPSDTYNAMVQKLGVHNNITYAIDEITEELTDDIRQIILFHTTGKGKARMKSNSNELRENHATWNMPLAVNANRDFRKDIQMNANPTTVDGALHRVIEFEFSVDHSVVSKQLHYQMLQAFMHNYGHVAKVYIPFLIQNYHRVKELLEERKGWYREKTTEKERFWNGTYAGVEVAAQLGNELGLFTVDINALRAEIWRIRAEAISDMRLSGYRRTPKDTLSEYLLNRSANTVVVTSAKSDGKLIVLHAPASTQQPKILVRLDHQKVYASMKDLNFFLVEQGFTPRVFCCALEEERIFLPPLNGSPTQKRITQGMQLPPVQVQVYEFDLSKLEIDYGEYSKHDQAGTAAADAVRGAMASRKRAGT